MKITIFPNYSNLRLNKTFKKHFSTITNNNNNNNLLFNFAITSLPHMSKRDKGGEDSSFAQKEIIGVADGVGGWNEVGVDPALYSRDLCSNLNNKFNETKTNSSFDLLNLFVDSCKAVKHRGSSTCCICYINKSEKDKIKLQTLNLGDSGYMILRQDESVFEKNNEKYFSKYFKSEEQTKGFNFPYQVGEGGDNPKKAVIKNHDLKENDLIVLASDGLWDNFYDEQLEGLINYYVKEQNKQQKQDSKNIIINNLQQLSDIITNTTEKLSLDQRYNSPFAARSQGMFQGGKHDDITIIVAQVIKESEKQEQNPKF